VKVSGGARTLAGVQRHMKYIEKKGEFGLETDMNTRASGPGFGRDLVRDWDLDVEALNHYSKKSVRGKPPRLVHNIIFSMPAGTSPTKVLEAVRRLALNEWALQHRYAMALHTDTPRPHVHVVVKAMSEQGVRLNIKKATLRSWRAQFAANLRELGLAANATERAVRGETRTHKRTPIYRAAKRNESSRLWKLKRAVLNQAAARNDTLDVGQWLMSRTRLYVVTGWQAVATKLRDGGDEELANEMDQFVTGMPAVRTEQSLISDEFHHQVGPSRTSEAPERWQ